MSYLYLSLAILAEIIATSALKYTEEFSRLIPSTIVITGYVTAFYFLTLTLREMNIGIVYAIWSGIGIIGIALIQHFWFKNALDMPAIIGMTFIITGVIIINLFSRSVTHT